MCSRRSLSIGRNRSRSRMLSSARMLHVLQAHVTYLTGVIDVFYKKPQDVAGTIAHIWTYSSWRGRSRLHTICPYTCFFMYAGIVDATWEYQLKPWDVTGGCVILLEAGGTLSTMDGKPYRYGKSCSIAKEQNASVRWGEVRWGYITQEQNASVRWGEVRWGYITQEQNASVRARSRLLRWRCH